MVKLAGMPPPTHNIIILTHGWTGSSVFSALLGRAGYWLGSDTVQKSDYDTFENADLVALNKRLLDQLAPTLDHEHCFDPSHVDGILRSAEGLDLEPYRDFVARCSAHGPWLWKDPRLTWSIRVWARVLDLDRTAFLVLTREDLQAWISANTRRHVQSWAFTRQYNHGITRSNHEFVESLGRPVLQLSFEDLLLAPEQTLDRLNHAFGLSLCLSDLKAVSREPLYRRSRDWRDLVEASLVYLKNFPERDGRARRGNYTSSATNSL
jgi:hypothetical protein